MEQHAKSTQKNSTKKFLNKIFHPNNSSKKNSSSVSPQENEWVPSFVADLASNHYTPGAYSQVTMPSRRSNEEGYTSQSPITRSNSIQRRYSFSNVHESGKQRLLAAKRAEYQEKMRAFDDLIQRRRGSTLRLALAPDVTTY